MPPKKRTRPAAAEVPPPTSEPEPEVSDDNASNHTDHDQHSDSDPDPVPGEKETNSPNLKFFNTTFSTFRVSPLYIAQNALTPAGREMLSRRLRDTLVGDVVRGVRVGFETDTTLGRLGTLDKVEWREYGLDTIFPTLVDIRGRAENATRQRHRGGGKDRGGEARAAGTQHILCLDLQYEKATFSALLLPSLDTAEGGKKGRRQVDEDELSLSQDPPSWAHKKTKLGDKGKGRDMGRDTGHELDDETSGFVHFPLLLTRMPAPLKSILIEFLSSTFDCRISPLHLGTRTLIHSWERWIEESGVSEGKALNKDVALTLGFHLEPSRAAIEASVVSPTLVDEQQHSPGQPETSMTLGLKTIDVVVPVDEVRRFLRIGKRDPHIGGVENNDKRRKRPANPTERERDRRQRRKLGGGRDEEGWTWRESIPRRQDTYHQEDQDDETTDTTETFDQPFTDALAHYLDHHLALDIFHPGVRVLRVVCDAFALSEGRIKVFAPPRQRQHIAAAADPAIETFLRDLIRRARGREWSRNALRLANLEVMA